MISPRRRLWIAAGALLFLFLAGMVYRNHRLNAAAGRTGFSLFRKPLPVCMPAPDRHPAIGSLQLAEVRARRLGLEGRFDEAVGEYRAIAKEDPTYPGIQLDLSVALLDAKQIAASSAAVEAQLATSGCLLGLPKEQVELYCHTEMPGLNIAACQQQVAGLQRTAHLQAALVQMQLGRGTLGPAAAAPDAGNGGGASRQ